MAFSNTMRGLFKKSNIFEPESVKEAIARLPIQENTKVTYCVVYSTFLKFIGKSWIMPKYTYRQKLPEFVPTNEELDQLIGGLGRKQASLCQLIRETGMGLGECLSLRWNCVNFDKAVITLTVAEKTA
jgi:integrase